MVGRTECMANKGQAIGGRRISHRMHSAGQDFPVTGWRRHVATHPLLDKITLVVRLVVSVDAGATHEGGA